MVLKTAHLSTKPIVIPFHYNISYQVYSAITRQFILLICAHLITIAVMKKMCLMRVKEFHRMECYWHYKAVEYLLHFS